MGTVLSSNLSLRYFFGLCLFLIPFLGSAQEEEETETETDTTETTYALGRLMLQNPNSIVSKYRYDPAINKYIYTEELGAFNINYPRILSPEEFKERVRREQMQSYFKEKIAAIDGRTDEAIEDRKSLLPGFYVNSGLFESIFGGNTIEFTPSGSVELDLGGLYTKQDNPRFSPRNRSNFSFDFDQRISLSLLGKIGERLQINANYDTEASFNFQNQIKLEYTPTEDDIIQKIEIGNVNMPLNSALIQGSQSLFGVKTQLQFGKTTVTGVFSEQQSQTRSVTAQGEATVQDFEVFALDYDENRHYFLAQYFRDTYDQALARYPFVNTNIQINRIEVWVTNRTQSFENTRNVVAVQDLGESRPENIGLDDIPAGFINVSPDARPDNPNNDFNPFGLTGNGQTILRPGIREASTVGQSFGINVNDGTDYALLENARKLNQNEYTLNDRLGYISLNQRLSNDEVLAVAYQYTVNGEVFQVGEFANDGIDGSAQPDDPGAPGNVNNTGEPQALIVKMLKSNITSVQEPVWDLMMKNIYSLGGGQLQQEGFRLNIVYTDPAPLNYIRPAQNGPPLPPTDFNPALVEETPLLNVFNLDRLTRFGDPQIGGDGFFDYQPGITVNPSTGSIIFTSVEPFGSYLFDQLAAEPGEVYNNTDTYNANQEKYVYRSLYESTKTVARDDADKNRFQLKGKYKSSQDDGIPIGGFNVPQGSVTVTAGGRVLQEGLDYTVDYQRGRVIILDPALKASNIPINVSTENSSLFGQQTKRFIGLNVEHRFNDDLIVGGTMVNLSERPLTQKASYSFEPINNTIFGLNASYQTEVPFLTRLINKYPTIDTDVPSEFSIRGEVAYLLPGQPKGTDFGGKAASYIDDFEGAQTSIDISSPLQWFLSSAPIGFGGELQNGDLASGYKRAKLAWYSIDPLFYSSRRPDGISDNDLSNFATRRIFREEIFPQQDVVAGTTQALFTLDLAYYPSERGAYNFSPDAEDGILSDPAENFGGIMRQFTSTDFEQSNVEYIEFWLMDPFEYAENATNPGGKLTLNLGNISEDVLKDGRKQYENGLPEDGGLQNTSPTAWGKVPTSQALVYAFDSAGQERLNQDIGYDGLDDAQERENFPAFAGLDDPAGDNYEFFVQAQGSILNRYKRYNGQEGNSPVEVTQTNRGSTTLPDVEDFNRDYTMNTVDSYFEYELDITPNNLNVSNPYVADIRRDTVQLQNGENLPTKWVQFKIPISQPTNTVGGISDFRSSRFMRMFMSNFQQETVLRFGTLNLVRGDYRRYLQSLDPLEQDDNNDDTLFEVEAISIQENEDRNPIPYTLPPGVQREELLNNNNTIRQNEQSLAMRVCDLEGQDSRGVYKNFRLDMRQYENIEMFVHAESLVDDAGQATDDLFENEMVAFIRIGTDLSENFYQIELPLVPTPYFTQDPEEIWPEANRFDVPLDLLETVKAAFINVGAGVQPDEIAYFDSGANLIVNPRNTPYSTGELRIGIKGNPSFGDVRVLMLGLKNGNAQRANTVCGEAWFNELRLSELKNEGGWAGIVNMDANIADFATVSATGRHTTIGFGGIDQAPNQRSLENATSYDVTTNVNVGQLLPQQWGIKIPFNYAVGGAFSTPKYDPLYTDLELETVLDQASEENREEIEDRAIARTVRQSINLIGVRKERTGEAEENFYDVENFAFSYSHNQEDHKDFEIESSTDQSVRLGATYNYAFEQKPVEPFAKNDSLFASKYWKLLKDFNFNYLPASVTVNSNIVRQFNRQKFRDITLNEGSIVPEFSQRNYAFDRQFTINFPLTKSLTATLDQGQNRIVRNYLLPDDRVDPTAGGVYSGFFDPGTPNRHFQTLQANYKLPLDKIPFLGFVDATYSYSADYEWNRGSNQLQTLGDIPNLGNTISNANIHALNGVLDMSTFYNSIGLKKITGRKAPVSREERELAVPTLGNTPRQQDAGNSLSGGQKAANFFIGLLTGVKRITINYEQNNGTYLPGFLPGVGFMGTTKPSLGYVFGSQADVRFEAARKGWLTLFQEFNGQYQETESERLGIQAQARFITDLTVDVNMNKNYQETYNENYRVDNTGLELEYVGLTGNSFGNYNISTIMLGSAFAENTLESAATFTEFEDNRLTIANRLAEQFYQGTPIPRDENGYPEGYGRNNQAVLIPAFLSAYTTGEADKVKLGAFRNIPLPNWQVKYTGFMKMDWFKKRFKRFSINHGYTSGYTINQFRTNLAYDTGLNNNPGDAQLDQAGNFVNARLFSNVNLTEQFSPLIRLDFEMRNSVKILTEIRKDRALSLSFDNNLLTEINGNEYIVGLGYRFKDITFATRVAGKRTILKSDINITADFSLRQNKTIVRYLDLDNDQVTSGQDIYGFVLKADYALSKNLSAIFFYDHSFATYAISTAFPQTTIRSGITLRYNFGN
ncbi:MAG: cell surface protein SprA [Leeuwenhoekiella sp.]